MPLTIKSHNTIYVLRSKFILLILLLSSCEFNVKKTIIQENNLSLNDTMKYFLFLSNNDSFEIIECPIDVEIKSDDNLNQNFKFKYYDLNVIILSGYYVKGEPVGEWLYKYIKNDSLLYKEVYWVNYKNDLLSFIAPKNFEHLTSSDTFIEFKTPDESEKFEIKLIDSFKASQAHLSFNENYLIKKINFLNQNPIGSLSTFYKANKFKYTVCFISKSINGKVVLLNYSSNNDLPMINVVLMEMIRNLKIANKKIFNYINNEIKIEYNLPKPNLVAAQTFYK